MINPIETCGAPLALPSATVVSELCRFLLFERSVVVLSRRSTFIDEDLGDVADPSAHGTEVDEDPHVIIHDLVEHLMAVIANVVTKTLQNLRRRIGRRGRDQEWCLRHVSHASSGVLCRCLGYPPWVSYSSGRNEGHTIGLVSTVDDGKMAPEALVKTAVSGAFSLLLHMSPLTLRGPVVDLNRRSTLYDENLGDVMDLSGHGTWADEDLDEIVHDLMEALSPVQSMSRGHGHHVATIGITVLKTSQDRDSSALERLQSVVSSIAALSESVARQQAVAWQSVCLPFCASQEKLAHRCRTRRV